MRFTPVPEKLPAGISGPHETLVRDGARVQEYRLANGLLVLLVERHLDPVVAVMTWYKVGARNEIEREAGVSHFLEHMMFKGSANFGKGQVDLVTTTLGGSNNAFTSADHTAYWFEFASDRWEKALEIESDRMRGLLLDAKEFDAEKAVVLEELAMGEDDPWRNLTQEVGHLLFPRHPYRRPVIGYADTLKKLSVEEMRDYYRRFYHPGNATLVVCGDFDTRAALAIIAERLVPVPAGVAYGAADCARPAPVEPKGEKRLTVTWDDRASRLCIAWPTAVVGSKDDYVLDVISTILTGGRLSRLYRRLVLGSAIATSISTHNDTRRETGSFWMFAELAQGRDPVELERAIDVELERIARELVPAKELARVKQTLVSGEAYDSETVSDLAEELGEFAADLQWKEAFSAIDVIRRVTPRDIVECARRLLAGERRVLGWSRPKASVRTEAKPAQRRESGARTKAANRPVGSKAARKSASPARSSANRHGSTSATRPIGSKASRPPASRARSTAGRRESSAARRPTRGTQVPQSAPKRGGRARL